MKTDVTTSIVLDKRRKRKDSLYPVKIRITHNRYSKYFATSYALTIQDFNKVMGKAPREDFKDIRKKLIEKEEEARIVIRDIDVFSFEEYTSTCQNGGKKETDVYVLFSQKIEKLNHQLRVKTGRTYNTTRTALKTFSKSDSLPIQRITVKFLEDFEQWMLKRNRSITTVGIYCRNIRSVFNDAIADGIVKHESYPFGRRKYQIPTGRSIKKALRKDDVLKILNYQANNEIEAYSRDMWIFSYLANGMNFTDIANLMKDSIVDGFLVFNRSKTIRSTRSNPILIKVFISKQMHEITQRWSNTDDSNDKYLFPILKQGMNPEQQANRVELAIRSINYHIGKIAKSVGIDKKVTTYTARHSFSTVLKRSGASVEFISESLGHQNISTTRHYLDSFEDDEKIKWSEKLL